MSLVYRGTSSDDVHFNVTERRVYNAPAFDVTGIEVPGRSGDILNSQERFKNKAIVYTGFIRSSDFPGDTTWERLSRGLRTIKAWICGDAGKYHDLTDDYDPGFVRRAFVSGETAISEVLDRPDGATITITFMAEPFMYEESDPIELPETGTASGAIASFEGVAAPLQSLKFSVEPSQDLHGYSYPWPGGGGVNMAHIPDATRSGQNCTTTVTDEVIETSGQANATYVNMTWMNDITIENGQSYTVRMNKTLNVGITFRFATDTTDTTYQQVPVNAGYTSAVFTANNNFAKFRIYVSGITSGTNVSISGLQILVGKGTIGSFSPYSNISPISGWSQVDAVAAGVNLLDSSDCINDAFLAVAKNTATVTAIAGASVYYAKVKPNTTYTLSHDNGDRNIICGYSSVPTIRAASNNVLSNYGTAVTPKTFTTGANDNYVAIYVNRYATSKPTKIQLEKGSVATTYAAPALTPITISLGQTVYGGTVDALSGKLDVAHKLTTFSGSKPSDVTAVSWNSTYNGVQVQDNSINTVNAPKDDFLCNTLVGATARGSAVSGDNVIKTYQGTTGNNPRYYFLCSSSWTSLDEFHAYCQTNPIQVLVPLATPQEYDLTPVSVSSLLGQNNIWANTGDTEVVYVEPTENPTEWPSKPRLEITMAGAGTLTVNGKTWSIGAYTGTLICDSEIMDWYDASNLKNSLVSGDGFPELQPGENVITYTGGITKVVAKPRWRTL